MTVLLALVGPTASGKSRMAVEVASEVGGIEIVSCDSMAVYRGLDIAADKPPLELRDAVPHHLLDLVDPSEPFTAVEYRDRARRAIEAVHERGRVPMLVGGSGLWFRAAVDELEFAPTDPAVRTALERADPNELYRRLREADPESAERIDPRNVRRLIRAVEILELTRRPPTELRRTWDRRSSRFELTVVGLTWERAELYARAEKRVRDELRAGLVEEVRRAGELSATARQALGVKEMLEHLEGRLSLEAATDLLVRNTKRFVRRQLSWFRADPRVEWVDASCEGWDGARAKIVARYRAALA